MTKILRKALVALVSFTLAAQPVLAQTVNVFRVPLGPQMTGADGGGVLSYSEPSHDFGAVPVTHSATHVFSVTNTGTAAITVHGITSSGTGFSHTTTCGAYITPGSGCTVTARFAPSSSGGASGEVVVQSDDVAPTVRLGLSGRGQAGTLSASGHTFTPARQINDPLVTTDIVVTNIGVAPVNVSGVSISSGGAHFSQSNNCGGLLAAGGTCTVTAGFSPAASGTLAGVLTLVSDSDSSPFHVALSGEGRAQGGTLAAESFGSVQVGETVFRRATLTNTGIGVLTVTGRGVSGADYSEPAGSTGCSANLAVGESCSFDVAFTPGQAAARPGQVSATTGAGVLTASLDGVGQAPGASLTTPAFEPVEVGTSASKTVTLTNTGVGAVAVGAPTVGGDGFTLQGHSCPVSLSAQASCTLTVRFAPLSAGAKSGALTVPTNAGELSSPLSATATQAVLTFAPASLPSFGNVQVGQTAQLAALTLTNTGSAAATGLSVTAATGFSVEASTCTGNMAPGQSCTMVVRFSPMAAQAYGGSLNAIASGSAQGATVPLAGTGMAQSGTVSDIAFGGQLANSAVERTATLANTGVGPLEVTAPASAGITGAGFTFVSTSCGSSLAVGASCTVTARFLPVNGGTYSGAIAVATGAGTLTAALTGQGLQGTGIANTSSLTFAATQVGQSSATQTVTVSNTGNTSLTVSGVSISTGGTDFAQSNDCGATLAQGGTCTVSVSFTPTAAGSRSGTLSMLHDGPGGVTTISLAGAGHAQSVALPSALAFGSLMVGASAVQTVTVTNNGYGPVSVTPPSAASVTGADFSFASTSCAATLAVSASCAVSVLFNPATNAAREGTLTLVTGAGTKSVALSGTGTRAVLALSYAGHTPGSDTIVWSATQVGSLAGSNTFVLTNVGNASAADLSVVAPAQWRIRGSTCTTNLAAGASCDFTLEFAPTTAGTITGALAATTSTGAAATAYALRGVGSNPSLAADTASPYNAGTNLTPYAASGGHVYYRNNGSGPVTINGAPTATGGGIAWVADQTSGWCYSGAVLQAGATCVVYVYWYSPGSYSSVVAVPSTGGAPSVTVTATLTPGLIVSNASFGDVRVGLSADRTVSVTNAAAYPVYNLSPSAATPYSVVANGCGNTLAGGASCSLTVRYSPTATGASTGATSVSANWNQAYGGTEASQPGSTVAHTGSLTGNGALQQATLSSIDFGNRAATSSTDLTVTLTNSGSVALDVTVPSASAVAGANFSFQGTNCPASLAAAASCVVTVRYSPASGGLHNGTVSVNTGAGARSANLVGYAVSARITGVTGPHPFGTVQVGQSATATALTLQNTGDATATGFSVTLPAGYSRSGTCPANGNSLAVNASCTLAVTFTPTAAQSFNGDMVVGWTGPNAGSAVASLTGTGAAQAATLTDIAFSGRSANSSTSLAATLTNTGVGPLSLTQPAAASVAGAGFAFQGTNCGTTLAAGAACTVTVVFNPTNNSSYVGSLTVATGAGSKAAALSGQGLQGTGIANPTSLSFGTVQLALASAYQAVTVTNNGNTPLAVSGVSIASGAADYSQSNNCGSTLAQGTSCTVNVQFNPSAAGSRPGTLAMTHNGPGGVTSVSLSGTGSVPALTMVGYAYGGNQNLGAVGFLSDSGRWPSYRNDGAGPLTITGHSVSNSPAWWAWQGDSGNSWTCYPGRVLQAGETCNTFVGIGGTGVGDHSSNSTVTYTSTGGGATYSNTISGWNANIRTTTPGNSSESFGSRQVGATSGVQTVRVTNHASGNVLRNMVVTVAGPHANQFTMSNGCGAALAGGTSCDISVRHAPSSGGSHSAQIVVTGGYPRMEPSESSYIPSNSAVSFSVALAGTGVAASATVTSGAWGSAGVGTTVAGAQVVTNTGIGPVTFPSGPSVNAPFAITSNGCTGTLGAGASCQINLSFSPAAAQAYTQTLTVPTSAGTLTSTSTGTGVPGNAAVSSSSLTFGAQTLNTTSGTQSFTLTNNGAGVLSISGISVSTGASDFAQSNNCGGGLASGGACTINVSFTPVGGGTRNGTVSLAHNGTGTSTVYLSGTGAGLATIPTAAFASNPITVGASTTFTWATSGASSASASCTSGLSGSGSGTSGSITVSGSSTGYCVVTAYNAAGTPTSRTEWLTVVAAPVVNPLTLGAANVTTGYNNTLNWTTSGASSVVVSCSAPASGSYSGGAVNGGITVGTSGTGTASCTVTAYNSAGASAQRSVNFNVVDLPSVVNPRFNTSASTVGDNPTFTWGTSNATSANVSCSGGVSGTSSALSGTINTPAISAPTGTCAVTAYNAAGQHTTASATLPVHAAASTPSVGVGAASLTVNEATSLSWSSSGATGGSVSCSGSVSGSGSGAGGTIGVTGVGTGAGSCTVTVTNAAGQPRSSTVSFTVYAAPSVSSAGFSTSSIGQGGTATFSWSTGNATSASVACSGAITGSGSGTSGSISVTGVSGGNGTCTVTAYNAVGRQAGTASGSANITVLSTPTATMGSSSLSMRANGYCDYWTYDVDISGDGWVDYTEYYTNCNYSGATSTTITNTGGGTLNLSQYTDNRAALSDPYGTYTYNFSYTGCPASLGAGQSCTLTISMNFGFYVQAAGNYHTGGVTPHGATSSHSVVTNGGNRNFTISMTTN